MHLKIGKSAGNCVYSWNGTIWRVMVASRLTVRFWPDGNTSPGNYGWLSVRMLQMVGIQLLFSQHCPDSRTSNSLALMLFMCWFQKFYSQHPEYPLLLLGRFPLATWGAKFH
jgi:hypothetical protein